MLYKVDIIEGKNLGCIALKTIKRGTLIVQEKPVCYDGGQIKEGCNWGHGLSAAIKLGSLEKNVGTCLLRSGVYYQ